MVRQQLDTLEKYNSFFAARNTAGRRNGSIGQIEIPIQIGRFPSRKGDKGGSIFQKKLKIEKKIQKTKEKSKKEKVRWTKIGQNFEQKFRPVSFFETPGPCFSDPLLWIPLFPLMTIYIYS